ncbi:MAG: energy-coupling factor transporter transmembrane protein EcfT [Clostridium sp.]|nr:energy-coupling factor transporter transmembrane protein EcfT [Clostridium sp.]
MQNNVPEWLKQEENYLPPKDADRFIDSCIKGILSALSRFKNNNTYTKAKSINTALRLFGILLAIILTSSAVNFYFVFVMTAVAAVSLAISSGQVIKNVLHVLLPVLLFTLLILLPSVLTSNAHTILGVTARVFVSVTLVMKFNLTTPWNSITSALKKFHIPDIIIFIFDTTIHYISILGKICFEMLNALKIRSIGKNKSKNQALSGILGTTFIKAKENAEITNQAMECRGFNGEFAVYNKNKFTKYDILYIIMLLAMVGIFIYFQAVMK